MDAGWTQTVIDALLTRDPDSWRGDGITPCEVVAEHFKDKRFRRIDYVLHELGHILMYPEGIGASTYYIALAALHVGDSGLATIVAELVSKITGFERTSNERRAIEFCAIFWLTHDPEFPAERYIRDCVIGQKHETEFAPGDIDTMCDTARQSNALWPHYRMERLFNVIAAWRDAPTGAASGFAV